MAKLYMICPLLGLLLLTGYCHFIYAVPYLCNWKRT